MYEETASDVQRFVDHLGHELLCAHVESVREQPAWLLAIQKVRPSAIALCVLLLGSGCEATGREAMKTPLC